MKENENKFQQMFNQIFFSTIWVDILSNFNPDITTSENDLDLEQDDLEENMEYFLNEIEKLDDDIQLEENMAYFLNLEKENISENQIKFTLMGQKILGNNFAATLLALKLSYLDQFKAATNKILDQEDSNKFADIMSEFGMIATFLMAAKELGYKIQEDKHTDNIIKIFTQIISPEAQNYFKGFIVNQLEDYKDTPNKVNDFIRNSSDIVEKTYTAYGKNLAELLQKNINSVKQDLANQISDPASSRETFKQSLMKGCAIAMLFPVAIGITIAKNISTTIKNLFEFINQKIGKINPDYKNEINVEDIVSNTKIDNIVNYEKMHETINSIAEIIEPLMKNTKLEIEGPQLKRKTSFTEKLAEGKAEGKSDPTPKK